MEMVSLNPLKWFQKTLECPHCKKQFKMSLSIIGFGYFGIIAWIAMILGLVSEELSLFFSFVLLGAFIAITFLVLPIMVYRLFSEKKK